MLAVALLHGTQPRGGGDPVIALFTAVFAAAVLHGAHNAGLAVPR